MALPDNTQLRNNADQQIGDGATQAPGGDFSVAAPSISLPKGGGAIRGIGEKFAANPVTGTASLSVPIATSPGRSGFGPQLSLSYDSGAGNGPFGFGWNLSLPSITRKTDKGLPRYRDAEDSDVFILSGAEDLVPVYQQDLGGSWVRDQFGRLVIHEDERGGFRIRRYRPRIEGLFARIERWTRIADNETYWRSISKDNITTWYGKTADSRIFDPDDPRRTFSWLICESYDDKGNAIVYEYVEENSTDINRSHAHETNRTDNSRKANRYLKQINYGNYAANRDANWAATDPTAFADDDWMFKVVFDYDEGHYSEVPRDPNDHQYVRATIDRTNDWKVRDDPFSTYRAGFEVRTYRLCRRVLMFHNFPAELGTKDCLVRSTDFAYDDGAIASFISGVTQSGYVQQGIGNYLKKSLPPLEFEYSQPAINETVHEVDQESLENLPIGLDGSTYQWIDLDGEGLSGILTEQADGWYYKRNLSPLPIKGDDGQDRIVARFAPLQAVDTIPSLARAGGDHRFLDLAGDGRQDVVLLERPVSGFYERTRDEGWDPFRNFLTCPNVDWADPNLRFVDLTGDGHADILIAENEVFTWYPSLAEEGFGPAEQARQALDEEKGPKLVFADGTQSIYLTDFSGDGLTDLARIRNGEICYWPNSGYGRFGAKITMDNSPCFDRSDQFNQQYIRLADIDGSGTADILYLGRGQVDIYRNEAGNRWGDRETLKSFPNLDNLSSVMVIDLLGNGTACLVWSSPAPGDAGRQMRYVDLMGGQKPHLMIRTVNNLGAETKITYAPSTKFYLQDKNAGNPWVTKIPFPVHVVERVETQDRISRNHFVTRHVYHHGYFDGVEREFRGFGMVEQWDTEEFEAFGAGGAGAAATNSDEAFHVPPVLTRSWFHTGIYLGRGHVSDFFAGMLDDRHAGEYYREPGLDNDEASLRLLDDTILPDGLSIDEEREACRALKGSMLRQEVYALDGAPNEQHPYTVTEQNFTIETTQPRGDNRHAVFFTHAREAINYHYEREPADPRVQHALTLEVDAFGNVLKEAAIGYGRRQPDLLLPLQIDQDKQTALLATYTENRVTNAIDEVAAHPDDYRTPMPCETRTYELTGVAPENNATRFSFDGWTRNNFELPISATEIQYEETADLRIIQKRLIEQLRIYYRPDDLGIANTNDPLTLLPLETVEPLALPGESYKLAFTPGLANEIYVDSGKLPATELNPLLANEGKYVHPEGDANWWIPSGRAFFSPDSNATATNERDFARQHFFLPHRTRDPFHTNAVSTESIVTYDSHNLLTVETRDALGNLVTAVTEDDAQTTTLRLDYRVLQPEWITDPNGNRTQVAFDALGMVVGTAIMGKPGENLGDLLDGFDANLIDAVALNHLTTPLADPHTILSAATTRLVYDVFAYHRTKGDVAPQPAVVYTLARETHHFESQQTDYQHSFSYSDGFGREIQKKIQAEPETINSVKGPPRWVGSGWTIFNNKGKPVRQYEPFFSDIHRFEFDAKIGVSPILFYDPVGRVVATLHPNHTFEKIVFDPWRQETYDVNDTCAPHPQRPGNPRPPQTGDPRTDPDIRGYVARYFASLPASPPAPAWQTWREQRIGSALGPHERAAAARAAAHADTPTTAHFDALGRPFLSLADNGPDPAQPVQQLLFATRTELDIEGNQREVINALGRIVMRYDYTMAGPEQDDDGAPTNANRIHQASMEAGERWMLNDIAGNPIRAWDSRGHMFRTEYDPLRRPLRSFVTGADPGNPNAELLTERLVYGEQHPQAEQRNLRGALNLHLDQAGAVATETLDFKGNPINASHRIAIEYKQAIDWSSANAALPADGKIPFVPATLMTALAPLLENAPATYSSETTYDALNRPITMTTPHTPAMQPSIIRPGYNEANLLERVDVNLRSAASSGQPIWTPFVTNIDYDAKGQRERIDYGNGVNTSYDYDPNTFRLIHLKTVRNAAGFDTTDRPGELQNLHYVYDPAGNITHIHDDAQQTIFFNNNRVEPSAEYIYDAIYRLIDASGREHLGQTGGASIPHSHHDAKRVGVWSGDGAGHFSPNDGTVIGAYVERYDYDAVGNIMDMAHHLGGNLTAHGPVVWRRRYQYAATNNRLRSTSLPGDTAQAQYSDDPRQAYSQQYEHDVHGNIISIPHLDLMQWDYRDQLQKTTRQVVNTPPPPNPVPKTVPETTYYVYDASGERVRKVTDGQNGKRKSERIYLGSFEVYREYDTDGVTPKLERETLHIMDDKQRIALVETRTLDTASTNRAPQQLIRYQLGNHLGSASLELDDQAEIISYEEYTPYGSSSYQAVRSKTKTPKRYRYTGKERDEENGFYYHGARYYAPWLGRWTAADPAGLVDGLNTFIYVLNNPVLLQDNDGMQSSTANSLDPTDPNNFVDIKSYAEANPDQPEQAVRDVWETGKRKKYLIFYDKGERSIELQAKQAAKDHGTNAHSVPPEQISDLIEREKPDVIMFMGHGDKNVISTGDSDWIRSKTLTRELKEANIEENTQLILSACSACQKGGLGDKISNEPSLSNVEVSGHSNARHVTRNPNKRLSNVGTLRDHMVDRLKTQGLAKRRARKVAGQIIDVRQKGVENKKRHPLNVVFRELNVVGFKRFTDMVFGDSAPEITDLDMTPAANERFVRGISILRKRKERALKIR